MSSLFDDLHDHVTSHTHTHTHTHRRQKNTLTLRMNASRKAREGRNTLVSRAFSPVQYRMNSRQDSSREGGGVGKGNEKTVLRAQRHTELVVCVCVCVCVI